MSEVWDNGQPLPTEDEVQCPMCNALLEGPECVECGYAEAEDEE